MLHKVCFRIANRLLQEVTGFSGSLSFHAPGTRHQNSREDSKLQSSGQTH